MSEEQTQTAETQPTDANADAGDKSQPSGLLAETSALVERMEKANKEARELAARNEAILSKMMISGRAEAGSVTKTPEEIQKEAVDAEIKAVMSRFYPK